MLSKQPFSTQDAVRSEDGELYHLPTLIALDASISEASRTA